MTAENQVMFAMGVMDDNVPFLILGVSKEAWEYMKDGKTHTFDLSKAGLPLRVAMFGCADTKTARNELNNKLKSMGMGSLETPGKDFGIDWFK